MHVMQGQRYHRGNREDAMSKYGAKKATALDGRVFPSKRECARYEELLLLQRMGQIEQLECQVRYELIPKQKGERAVTYTADFRYLDKGGKVHVEDTKGFRTQQYVIRRKLMLWIHGVRIEEL